MSTPTGQRSLSRSTTRERLRDEVARDLPGASRSDPAAAALSDRQAEILHSIFKGLSDPDIAKQLGISVYTVKEHISKLGAANRTEAAAIALRKHLLKI